MKSEPNEVPASTWPKSGDNLVKDAETAVRIGVLILRSYYGRNIIDLFEPYGASRGTEGWYIVGTSQADLEQQRLQKELGPDSLVQIRGRSAPIVLISEYDAQVIRISISR